MKKEFIDKLLSADLILVGVGTEFQKRRYSKEVRAVDALKELAKILEGKNYFVITTCTNSILKNTGLNEERMVSPCGNLELKQCECCANTLQKISEKEQRALYALDEKEWAEPDLGVCEICGKPMVFNSFYTANYDENGYLQDWEKYTKWLQGTLNKNLCVLELGAGFNCASIIRFPFEKIAYYNQKATFIRVNEKLPYMTEELKDKGTAIAQNSIDWLLEKDI